MHSTTRKRSSSLDLDSDSKVGLVDESTITTPPKKRSKTTAKKEVVNDEQVKLPLTSKQEDDAVSMPYTPLRETKPLPAVQSDDEYQEPAFPSPSPKPKLVKKTKKAAAPKPKSPKTKKAPAPKPPKVSVAERKAQWVAWCNEHAWRRDPSFKPQDGERWYVMHGGDAAKYFNFRPEVELRVVPYYKFLNEKNPSIRVLAYRKLAYLKRHIPEALGEPGAASEQSMLDNGEELFASSIQRLKDKYRKMQDNKIKKGKLKPYERKERAGPIVYNTKYLPPPMNDEDGSDGDEEIEDDVEYDSDS
ncbi:hypothetical protein BDZ89DRAFT_1064963 [Hymenopellis radicata]|nr:hypothetical protein BDZ89DRAFT_1064963 [Hymenopellis radicata]